MEFLSPDSLPQPLGYSHAVVVPAGRRLVITSGQVGMLADGTVVDGLEAQTRQTFDNLTQALQAAGASWTDVVKLTYFVTSTDDLPVVRAVRDEYVDTSAPPTSSLIRVAGLFRPDVLIEIEATAAIAD